MFNVRHFAARAGKRPLCPVLLATIASLRVLRLNMSTSHTLQPAITLHNMWINVCAGSSLLIAERLWPRWAIQSSWPLISSRSGVRVVAHVVAGAHCAVKSDLEVDIDPFQLPAQAHIIFMRSADMTSAPAQHPAPPA